VGPGPGNETWGTVTGRDGEPGLDGAGHGEPGRRRDGENRDGNGTERTRAGDGTPGTGTEVLGSRARRYSHMSREGCHSTLARHEPCSRNCGNWSLLSPYSGV